MKCYPSDLVFERKVWVSYANSDGTGFNDPEAIFDFHDANVLPIVALNGDPNSLINPDFFDHLRDNLVENPVHFVHLDKNETGGDNIIDMLVFADEDIYYSLGTKDSNNKIKLQKAEKMGSGTHATQEEGGCEPDSCIRLIADINADKIIDIFVYKGTESFIKLGVKDADGKYSFKDKSLQA